MVTLKATSGYMIKRISVYGGCLGSQRRRRTWTAAISSGEPLTGYDPGISEWGNPNADEACACGEFIAVWQQTRGTETSKYSEEKKETSIPSVAASERGRAQTGALRRTGVVRPGWL